VRAKQEEGRGRQEEGKEKRRTLVSESLLALRLRLPLSLRGQVFAEVVGPEGERVSEETGKGGGGEGRTW
jgi:hypothetical protein